MATGLESAVHLVRYAAWLHAAGRPHHKEAAMVRRLPAFQEELRRANLI